MQREWKEKFTESNEKLDEVIAMAKTKLEVIQQARQDAKSPAQQLREAVADKEKATKSKAFHEAKVQELQAQKDALDLEMASHTQLIEKRNTEIAAAEAKQQRASTISGWK